MPSFFFSLSNSLSLPLSLPPLAILNPNNAISRYAPEAIHSNTFTTKSDAWAWGITFWEIMASGATPYGEQTGTQVLQLLERGQRLAIPTEFSVGHLAPCCRLLEKVWLSDPRARPSFAEIYTVMHSVVPETTEGM